MKTLGYGALGLALLFASAGSADAQSVKTGGRKDSAKTITISGEIDFPLVHRSEEMSSVLDRSHAWDYDVSSDGAPASGQLIYQKDSRGGPTPVALNGVTTGTGPINSPAETFVNPQVRINFDIELAEKVSALISLETRRLESDPNAGNQQGVSAGNSDIFGTRQDWGTNANKSLMGDENVGVTIGQAYIKVSEFLLQQLSLKVGIQDLKYDLRGNGQCWFMDLRHAEYAFLSPTTENFGPEGSVYGYRAFNPNAHTAGAFRDEISSPGGARLTFNSGDTLVVDLFAMKTLSGRNFFGDMEDRGVLNQNQSTARRSGESESHFDEDVYGLNVDFNIPDSKSMVNFIATAFSGDAGSSMVWTVGAGADYFLDSLELYGEIYGQWGTYGKIRGITSGAMSDPFGDNIARTRESSGSGAAEAQSLHRSDVDQEAWMLHAGARYTMDSKCKPWLEVSGAYVSGDDGDVDDEDAENNDFVSYESNNETLILEDATWGLDVDSNYWKVALGLGGAMSLDHADDLRLSLTWTYAEVAETPDRVGRTHTAINRGVGGGAEPNTRDSRLSLDDVEDQLGHELDLRVTWEYSESLTFGLNVGWLIDPEFFASDDTYRADGDMYMFMIDTNLRF